MLTSYVHLLQEQKLDPQIWGNTEYIQTLVKDFYLLRLKSPIEGNT